MSVRLRNDVQGQFPAQLDQRGSQQDSPEEHERDTVEYGAHLLGEPVEFLRVTSQRPRRNTTPAVNAAMEPKPCSALPRFLDKPRAAPAAGITCRQEPAISPRPPAWRKTWRRASPCCACPVLAQPRIVTASPVFP